MKRVVRASKYSEKSDHYKRYLKFYASVLVDACNAETDLDFEDIAAKLGLSSIKNQQFAIKAAVERVDDAASEYLLSANAESKYPEVKDTLVDYLEGLGYAMTPVANPARGFDKSYFDFLNDYKLSLRYNDFNLYFIEIL